MPELDVQFGGKRKTDRGEGFNFTLIASEELLESVYYDLHSFEEDYDDHPGSEPTFDDFTDEDLEEIVTAIFEDSEMEGNEQTYWTSFGEIVLRMFGGSIKSVSRL